MVVWNFIVENELIGPILISLGLFFTILTLKSSEKSRKYQVLSDILRDYRSDDMGIAVGMLWDLYKRNDENEKRTIEAYWKEVKIGLKKINNSSKLHLNRRKVAHFYSMLAEFHARKFVPEKVLFKHWVKKDLDIIPGILIPISREIKLEEGRYAKEDLDNNPPLVQMQKLYEDCENYYNKSFKKEILHALCVLALIASIAGLIAVIIKNWRPASICWYIALLILLLKIGWKKSWTNRFKKIFKWILNFIKS